jgi:hypothetical protein
MDRVRKDVENLAQEFLEKGKVKYMSLMGEDGSNIKFIDNESATEFIKGIRKHWGTYYVLITYQSVGISL